MTKTPQHQSKHQSKHEDEPVEAPAETPAEETPIEAPAETPAEETPVEAPTPPPEQTPEQVAAVAQPQPTGAATKPWAAPNEDCEFVFRNNDSLPDWVDRNWVGFDRGASALVVPVGDPAAAPAQGVYAHPGDRVRFIRSENRFVVEPAQPAQTGFPHAGVSEIYGAKPTPAETPPSE